MLKQTRQTASEANFSCLDVRVGKIISIEKHPNADSLYVEKIDVGEGEPRTIVSGLADYYTLEQMANRKVLVICNLPPKALKGVNSKGMVFCASTTVEEKRSVYLLDPPDNAVPGEKVFCEGVEGEVDNEIKGRRWNKVSALLKTNSDGFACFKDIPFRTQSGLIKASPIKNGDVS